MKKLLFIALLSLGYFYVTAATKQQASLWSKLFGPSIDALNNNFSNAVNWGRKSEAIEALNAGADPNFRSPRQSFSTADAVITNDWPDVLDLMLDLGLNPKGTTLLNHAIMNGFPISTIQRLIQLGSEVNVLDKHDRFPLMYARFREVVQLLLDAGAQINQVNKQGQTALHIAVLNSTDIAILLLDNGADVNAKDKSGRIPLHYAAAKNGKLETVKLLLSRGADINAAFGLGVTPLLTAQVSGNEPVYYYLSTLGK